LARTQVRGRQRHLSSPSQHKSYGENPAANTLAASEQADDPSDSSSSDEEDPSEETEEDEDQAEEEEDEKEDEKEDEDQADGKTPVKKQVRKKVTKSYKDKNGHIIFPALSRSSSDVTESSEHEQAVRAGVQEHLVASTAVIHEFFEKLQAAAKKVSKDGGDVNHALLHLGERTQRGAGCSSTMMGLESRGAAQVTDICNALNNGRSNDVIAVDVNKGLSQSHCDGTLEGLARLVDLFERSQSILGILGKEADRGTLSRCF